MLFSCKKEMTADSTDASLKISNTRSMEEAERFAISALSMLDEDTKASFRVIGSRQAVTSPMTKDGSMDVDTLFYVFNFEENAGFALINANIQADPFICITESGNYTDGEPSGVDSFDAYITQLKAHLEKEELLRVPPIEDPVPVPDDSLVIYKYTVNRYEGSYKYPLINTKWGKDGIYGAYCPNGAAGCVARAIAQIMAYHGHPSAITLGQESGIYSSGTSLTMHWSNIRNHTINHSGTQSCSAYHSEISALIYDISERVHMTYYTNGSSGASFSYVQPAFVHYGYFLDSVANVDINDMIASIDANRPVILSGLSAGVGHAWIADGYKDYILYCDTYARAYPGPGYYLVNSVQVDEKHAMHFNWGWDGECNGYFNFGIYNTSNPDSYDGNINTYHENYTTDLQMHTNIRVANY